jgi:Tol biopolymer transport system component
LRKRPFRQRLAFVASLALGASALVAIPVATVVSAPQAAHAAVANTDVVFTHRYGGSNGQIYIRKGSDGSTSNLSNNNGYDAHPDGSPNGSQIAFSSSRPGITGTAIWIMNSDGSGQAQLTSFPPDSGINDAAPSWSPLGDKILFARSDNNGTNLFVVNTDGTNLTQLTTDNMVFGSGAGWSPDASKIVYSRGQATQSLYVVNANGTSNHQVGSGSAEHNPTWSPNGSRIYYNSCGSCGIHYYTSTDGFLTSANATDHTLTSGYYDDEPTVSADSSTVIFISNDRNGCCELYSISSSGGAATKLTDWNTGDNESPSYVKATYPATPPSNSTVTIAAPKAHDAPYTRDITIAIRVRLVDIQHHGPQHGLPADVHRPHQPQGHAQLPRQVLRHRNHLERRHAARSGLVPLGPLDQNDRRCQRLGYSAEGSHAQAAHLDLCRRFVL